jgi:hypothetical protein
MLIGNISKLLAVELGNDECMATAERVDVEEGEGLVALEELEAWDVSWSWL